MNLGNSQRTPDKHIEIHSVPMGPFTNSFLINGDRGAILVDTGFPKHEAHFFRKLQRLRIEPGRIALIVATHGHADHVGNLAALKRQIGAKVAIHRADSHLVKEGIVAVPPAATVWGRILSLFFRILSPLGRFDPIGPEIVIDGEFSLGEFGITGRIIPTPGHTAGSVSVILERGETFVGDLAVNAFPFEMGLGIPAIAENVQDIYVSWQKLLSAGATTIYPAHGKPFPADRLKRKLSGVRDRGSAVGTKPRIKNEANPRVSTTQTVQPTSFVHELPQAKFLLSSFLGEPHPHPWQLAPE